MKKVFVLLMSAFLLFISGCNNFSNTKYVNYLKPWFEETKKMQNEKVWLKDAIIDYYDNNSENEDMKIVLGEEASMVTIRHIKNVFDNMLDDWEGIERSCTYVSVYKDLGLPENWSSSKDFGHTYVKSTVNGNYYYCEEMSNGEIYMFVITESNSKDYFENKLKATEYKVK